MKISNMEKYYYNNGRRWIVIDRQYFETVLVDFFGRPHGWWNSPLFFQNEKVGVYIKPKEHINHLGFTRNGQGKFRRAIWANQGCNCPSAPTEIFKPI